MKREPPEVLTVKEAADYLRCSTSTIYRLSERGVLPSFRVGAEWRFRRDELDAWTRPKRE